MAILFSHVSVSTNRSNEVEFLVSGIPKEFSDLEHYTAFEDFLDHLKEDTEILVHAEAYLYGDGNIFRSTIEEIAYFTLRMDGDNNFLSGHCNHIESVGFTCHYSPNELFGVDWR